MCVPDLAEHSSLLREGRRLFTNFSERMVNFIFCRKEFCQEHLHSIGNLERQAVGKTLVQSFRHRQRREIGIPYGTDPEQELG